MVRLKKTKYPLDFPFLFTIAASNKPKRRQGGDLKIFTSERISENSDTSSEDSSQDEGKLKGAGTVVPPCRTNRALSRAILLSLNSHHLLEHVEYNPPEKGRGNPKVAKSGSCPNHGRSYVKIAYIHKCYIYTHPINPSLLAS